MTEMFHARRATIAENVQTESDTICICNIAHEGAETITLKAGFCINGERVIDEDLVLPPNTAVRFTRDDIGMWQHAPWIENHP